MFTVRFIAISGLICCIGGWLIGCLISEFVVGCKHVVERREKKVNANDKAGNSVALVRTRTIPTERPPPVSEVSANFCG